jgi:nicotinamidase-related amidase
MRRAVDRGAWPMVAPTDDMPSTLTVHVRSSMGAPKRSVIESEGRRHRAWMRPAGARIMHSARCRTPVRKAEHMPIQTKRDPRKDQLLTPENAALVLIDYQPPQVYTVTSMDAGALVSNVIALTKTARLFGMPIVLSTVNCEINGVTIPQLRTVLPDMPAIDRTSINAWEDDSFVAAVRATARKKLIIAALWTEVCLVFPALDAIEQGFEVYAPVDCVGGTTLAAHEAGLDRLIQAGAKPVNWSSVLCELQRDWSREKTAGGMLDIARAQGGSWGTEIFLKQDAAKPRPERVT